MTQDASTQDASTQNASTQDASTQNAITQKLANSRCYFGTDGMRGTANIFPITPGLVLRLAEAAATFFRKGKRRHRVVIGKDTRLSGYMLEPALTAGFVSMGFDVTLVGPMPTPAVAMLTRSMRADLGVVISASHNPYYDNGIKLFGADGFKLDDASEQKIEALMHEGAPCKRAKPERLGRAQRIEDAPGRYIEFVKNSFPRALNLSGLRIALDCANGAAYRVMPPIFWELGANIVKQIGTSPDGKNINKDRGVTSPARIAEITKSSKADIGIAVDGDADRLLVVSSQGQIIDGNHLLAAITEQLQASEEIRGDKVVSTILANLGLERYLNGKNLQLLRTNVGDRYVVERMRRENCNIGGEPSGHIVLSDYSTTGDALVAALQVCAIVVRSGKSIDTFAKLFDLVPQRTLDVELKNHKGVLEKDSVKRTIEQLQQRLSLREGRLLVRPSGTESVVRIMAEGEDEKLLAETLEATRYALLAA